MTNEQAGAILTELIEELEANGFGEVVRQVRIRLEEAFGDDGDILEISNRQQLKFYLSESIQILDSMSVSHLSEIIGLLNEFTQTEQPINEIRVALINEQYYNLSELPDYTAIITVLRNIQSELSNE